jgi:two-component system nitrate/nitrite response regulator NarL
MAIAPSPAGGPQTRSQLTGVLVAGWVPLFRQAIADVLASDRRMAVSSVPAREDVVLFELARLRPAVLLVHLKSFSDETLALLERACEAGPETIILAFSPAGGLDAHGQTALRALGVGTIPPDLTEGELVRTIGEISGVRSISAGVDDPRATRAGRGLGTPGGPLLSARETETLQLIANGHAAPQVADRLFVSESTVKTYLRRTYVKLAVTGQAAAVAVALRMSLID